MKRPTFQMPAALQAAQERLRAFWQEREARERRLLAAAGTVVLLALAYLLLVGPALEGRERLAKTLPQLRQQAAEMQSLAAAATQIAQQAPPPAAPLTREGIDASLARSNLKPQTVLLTGDQLKLQLTNASFAALVGWLDEQQRSTRLALTEATIDVQPTLDIVNGTLTLRRQGGEPAR